MTYHQWHATRDASILLDAVVGPGTRGPIPFYRRLRLIALTLARGCGIVDEVVSHHVIADVVAACLPGADGSAMGDARQWRTPDPVLNDLRQWSPEMAARDLAERHPDPAPVVRDILSHPADVVGFRPSYRTPDVLMLAAQASLAPDLDVRLALADALEEAGYRGLGFCETCAGRGRAPLRTGGVIAPCHACDGEGVVTAFPVLDHLRSPGPHYPGCWAVELAAGH